MTRLSSMRSFLAVLALAIFALPASGAHLHVCFDGSDSEPSATVHMGDIGLHHLGETGSAHDDTDASLENGAFVKKIRAFLDLPVALPATPVLFVQPAAIVVEFPRERGVPFVSPARYRTLPPLRAPPA